MGETSPWVARWAHLVRPGGSVLDVACGHGRHLSFFAQLGAQVVGVDRSAEAIDAVSHLDLPWAETVLADIENGPWPLIQDGQPRQFDAVVVTNYLWRALFPVMAQSLAPGGVLIYETFASGNEAVGKPSRPDFLLGRGELLRAFPDLRVLAFEDGFLAGPPRYVQRLVAVREEKPDASNRPPNRYPL